MSQIIPLTDLGGAPRPVTSAGQVALVALGCAKNLVDAEQMLGALCADGYTVTADCAAADVIVVNTCSFLAAARDEALRELRQAARFKTRGHCQVLVASGCLAQMQPEAIRERCPEVDIVVGVSEFPRLAELVREVRGERGWRPVAVSLPDLPYQEYLPRRRATPPWTAYLKIAEGCNCNCSFCTIPAIRGAFRSRPIPAIVDEAQRLAADGVKELVLIAEDTTQFGHDRDGRRRLGDLLRALGEVPGIHWIRLLYCYPTKVDDDLIAALAEVPQVVPYLDMPLQHAHDDILRAMNRGGRRGSYLRLLAKLRAAVPDICLRSTFIVGFPGERREELAALESFLDEAQLDRVGFFPYSREPGTPAAELPGQVLPKVAEARVAALAARQAAISQARQAAQVGRTLEVLVESVTRDGCAGRSVRDAPEIDGVVRFQGTAAPGDLVKVLITDGETHDLVGREVSD